jgi:DNA excision repair protein ERCC-3
MMQPRLENPLIIQSDRTLLLEVQNPLYEEVREKIAPFAELLKSPEYIHTYRITPLSLWNAASAGMKAEEMVAILERYAKYGLPESIRKDIYDQVGRFGLLKIEADQGKLWLTAKDPLILQEVCQYKSIQKQLGDIKANDRAEIPLGARGTIKQELIKLGYPVQDLAGYAEGEALSVNLLPLTRSQQPFRLREYQARAVDAFYAEGSVYGGSGVLVLPCGAGKTIIGLAVMAKVKMETLILTTNGTSVRQWIREILDKTDLKAEDVGEYTGERKEVRPVTVATYQILTYRSNRDEQYPHLSLFNQRNWGLIIYDEVHLLPAPVFRITADIQAKRRLGLTATLVREDGREEDVFTLIGSKKAEVQWKELEQQGWIAEALCKEIRIPMESALRERYVTADLRNKYRIAAENPKKLPLIRKLLSQHEGDQVLIIGQYVEQLERIAEELQAPLITGKTPQMERDHLYQKFRTGEINRLIVSKVANFAIDLPDANVAIQVSGTFGSRQEEAQRLGRIIRPKQGENRAYFYTLVTRDSKDQDYAFKRQLFLVEQGYSYQIIDEE